MLAADLPGIVDGRAIFRFSAVGQRFPIKNNDTTTGAILAGDSARLTFFITRRDTAAHDLTVRLYRLPIAIDTTTTFADLSQAFTDSLLRTVNLDTLTAKPGRVPRRSRWAGCRRRGAACGSRSRAVSATRGRSSAAP